jgi:hypothetical protein
MEVDWKSGAPIYRGLYWFDNGLRFGGDYNRKPVVLHMSNGHCYMHGSNGGGCPLESIYNKDRCENAVYTEIQHPGEDWIDYKSFIKSKSDRAWVKQIDKYDGKIHTGFILVQGRCNGIECSVIWITKNLSVSGAHLKETDNPAFAVVPFPPLAGRPCASLHQYAIV